MRGPHGNIETEVRYFFTAWGKQPETIEQLRADIRPGERSSASLSEYRLKVLHRFDQMVSAAEEKVLCS